MDKFTTFLGTIEVGLWTWIGVPVLVLTAVGFTVATRGAQFRCVPAMFRAIGEKAEVDGTGERGVSAFKSFCISAASRVGTGNIVGVAVAIGAGGPGAIFWMWVMGLLVGSTSMIESTLAQVYKTRDESGFRGGPAYYIRRGLKLPWLAAVFAILISLVYGFVFNSIQANSIVDAMKGSLPTVDPALIAWGVGLVLAALTAPIIFSGARRIADVAGTVIPIIALFYMGVCVVLLLGNLGKVPGVLQMIVSEAFSPQPVGGAVLGFAIVLATGVQRGLFSNEAGMGSVPNAAAAASVSHPAKQGLVQTLGVYFDTLLVCSLTAFVILVSDWRGFMTEFADDAGPGAMTQNAIAEAFSAFNPILGPPANHFVTICIFLFAGTSLFGNYYYGETNILYAFGSRPLLNVFRVGVLAFIVVGAVIPVDVVWSLGNVAMPFLALVNIGAIVLLAPIALKVLGDFDRQVADGKDPVFTDAVLPGADGVECWSAPTESAARAST